MRALVAAVLVVGIALIALWQFGVLGVGGGGARGTPPAPDIAAAVRAGDPEAVGAAVDQGADVHALDDAGLTPLMLAASLGSNDEVLARLLDAGAEIDRQAPSGVTALMLASGDGTSASVLWLMNAGADPTLRDAEGRNALDYADTNSAVRNSGIYGRLAELAPGPFLRGWPSGYVMPVEGATVSSRQHHLPGASRSYRNGVHEGFDFFSGTVSVAIEYGTPVLAVAQGTVIRADTDYQEMSPEQYQAIIEQAKAALDTPPEVLDRLRGRQVWIRHPGGFVSRYAHLSAVADGVVEGGRVRQGQAIGATGNSGTEEAARGTRDDPHPHVEVWNGDRYLGQQLQGDALYQAAAQVWGQAALPPYHD